MVDPVRFADQEERTRQADLRFPIHIIYWNGRWTIIDGLHRLLKAVMEERSQVLVCKVPEAKLGDILCDPPVEAEYLEELSRSLESPS
jgi:hypothetical protein